MPVTGVQEHLPVTTETGMLARPHRQRMIGQLIGKLRRAAHYNSEIAEKLQWRMRDGTTLGRVANVLLWSASQLEYRTRGLRVRSTRNGVVDRGSPAEPTVEADAPAPWNAPLTAASRHSLGGRIVIIA